MKEITLTAPQIRALFAAIRMSKSDYQQDYAAGVRAAKFIILKLSEVENKLIDQMYPGQRKPRRAIKRTKK